MSKTGTGSGRKKSLAWNHFEKVKVDEGVTMAVCNYCKNHIWLIVRVVVLVIC